MHLLILILVSVCFTGLADRCNKRITFHILNTKYKGRFAVISGSVYFTLSFISSFYLYFYFYYTILPSVVKLFPLTKTKVTPSSLREPLQGTGYR